MSEMELVGPEHLIFAGKIDQYEFHGPTISVSKCTEEANLAESDVRVAVFQEQTV